MCVKAKRIDVAEICLGNMKFARGSKAVEPPKEAKKDDWGRKKQKEIKLKK